MRKYLFNGAMIGAITSSFGIIQATRNGPRDWRLILMWVSWGISLTLAIAAVREEAQERALEQ
ncbi:hypothetical protein [Microterricola viridarii]|uniref:Uncharacterized protein n=1 Tax=Microterricola viridarii TaxID=412690 RepID=A0A0Y0NE70_9MICO|nr:hypothetical protein [Microterricola viridarii]AMB58076.1 hypothetical protein AWU67_03470 [Microterricola viridarii]